MHRQGWPCEFFDAAREPHPAGRQHDRPLADRLHIGQHVRAEENCFAVITGQRDEAAEHRLSLDWIEAVCRLVEDDQRRIVHNRCGKGDLLPGADRERLQRSIPLLAGIAPVEHLVGPSQRLAGRDTAEPCRIPHHAHAGQAGHRRFIFRHHPHLLPHLPRGFLRIEAEDPHAAAGELHQAEHGSHQGALARAVGTDEAGDPRLDTQRNAVECGAAPVAFDNTVEFDWAGVAAVCTTHGPTFRALR